MLESKFRIKFIIQHWIDIRNGFKKSTFNIYLIFIYEKLMLNKYKIFNIKC